MRKSVFAMLRVLVFGVLMLPMVSCEEDVVDDKDKTEQGSGENEDFFVNAIDLGLSVKWAEHNVGATKPEEYGGYYAWGEVEEKERYSALTYSHYQNESFVNIGEDIKGSKYDVAHVEWGGDWRMPTFSELEELFTQCSWVWTSFNGVNGYKITGPNNNSIFLPAAGYRINVDIFNSGVAGAYWSSIYLEDYSEAACGLYFDGEGELYCELQNDLSRYRGYTVRPVKDK